VSNHHLALQPRPRNRNRSDLQRVTSVRETRSGAGPALMEEPPAAFLAARRAVNTMGSYGFTGAETVRQQAGGVTTAVSIQVSRQRTRSCSCGGKAISPITTLDTQRRPRRALPLHSRSLIPRLPFMRCSSQSSEVRARSSGHKYAPAVRVGGFMSVRFADKDIAR
jgi:hypothetical protein